MNKMQIGDRNFWTKAIVILGSIGLLIGAFDPMEGSVIILIGSALMALGTFLNRDPNQHFLLRYRLLVFVLIAIGVGAMFGLSSVGGIGAGSGHTMWWGLLILPYLVGWSMGIWGPGNPRWFLILGIVVGLWYLTLCGMILSHPANSSAIQSSRPVVVTTIGATGVVTITGSIARLRGQRIKALKS